MLILQQPLHVWREIARPLSDDKMDVMTDTVDGEAFGFSTDFQDPQFD